MINFGLCYVTSIYICLSVRPHFIRFSVFFINILSITGYLKVYLYKFTHIWLNQEPTNQPKANVSKPEDFFDFI